MHRALIAAITALIAVLLAACGGAEPAEDGTEAAGGPTEVVSEPTQTADEPLGGGGSAAGACALLVEYDGRTYFGGPAAEDLALGESLGQGTFPPCNDTPGVEGADAGEPVEVFAIEGVDPQDAVAVDGRTEIFVREGVDPATVLGD